MPGLGRSWDELFQALVHYKELHGDCNVPQYYQQDPGLGQWVGKQRSKYGDPNDPKHIRLSSIDFDWTSQEERNENIWNEKFGRLLQYKAKHGHCRVPKGFKDDPELGNFVSMQRILKKKERLSKDRQDKLDSVQFTWELVIVKNNHGGLSTKLEEKWMEKYAKLVEYKHLHGHCIVPKMYKPGNSKYFVVWMSCFAEWYGKITRPDGATIDSHTHSHIVCSFVLTCRRWTRILGWKHESSQPKW